MVPRLRGGRSKFLPSPALLGAPLRLAAGGAFALLLLLGAQHAAHAQASYLNYGSVSAITPNYSALVGTNQPISLDAFGAQRVNCIEGCSATSGPINGTASSTAPSYGAGTNPFSLDLSGGLRTTDEAGGAVSPGTAGAKSLLIGGIYNSSTPTLLNGQQAAAQFDSSGNLKVNVQVGGGTGGTSSTFSATFPGSGTAIGFKNTSGNMAAGSLDSSGNFLVDCASGCNASSDTSNGPVSPGTAATTSKLTGFVFNTSAPSLSNGQQAAGQVDSSGNQLVNLKTALPSGTNPIGDVGGMTVSATVTPTITAAAYTNGQCVGGLQTYSTAARASGPGSGLVQDAFYTDVSGQDASIDLWIFNANPTSSTFTDHGTCTIANADLTKKIATIHLTDCALDGATAPGDCQAQQQAIPFTLGASNQTLWAQAVDRGSPTYTATSNLAFRLTFLQD